MEIPALELNNRVLVNENEKYTELLAPSFPLSIRPPNLPILENANKNKEIVQIRTSELFNDHHTS